MNQKTILKYIAGSATGDEKDEVVRWLSESEDNEREFLALHRLNDITIWKSHRGNNSERELNDYGLKVHRLLLRIKFA